MNFVALGRRGLSTIGSAASYVSEVVAPAYDIDNEEGTAREGENHMHDGESLQEEVDSLRAEKQELKEQLSNLESSFQSSIKTYQDMLTNKGDTEPDPPKVLREELRLAREVNLRVCEREEELKAQIAVQKDLKKQLQSSWQEKVDSLETELSSLRTQNVFLSAEVASLSARTTGTAGAEPSYDGLAFERGPRQSTFADGQEELQSLRKVLENKDVELSKLSVQLRAKGNGPKHEQALNQKEELEAQVAKERLAWEAERGTLRQQIDRLTIELNQSMGPSNENVEKQFQREILGLRALLSATEVEKVHLSERCKAAEDGVRTNNERTMELEMEVTGLREGLTSTEEEEVRLRQKNLKLQEEANQLQKESVVGASIANAEAVQLKRQVQEMQQELAAAKDRIQLLNSEEMPFLRVKLAESKAREQEVKEELARSQNTACQYKQVVNQMREMTKNQGGEAERTKLEKESLLRECKLQADENLRLTRQLQDSKFQKSIVENLEGERNRLQQLVASLESELQMAKAGGQAQERQLREQLNEMTRSYSAIAQEVHALRMEASATTADLAVAEADRQRAEVALQNLTFSLEQFQQERATDAARLQNRKQKDMEEAAKAFQAREVALKAVHSCQVDEIRKEMTALIEHEKRVRASKEGEIIRLRGELVRLEKALHDALERLKTGGVDETISRELVSSIIVRYITDRQSRLQVLALMASMFGFTHQQKVQVGLEKGDSGGHLVDAVMDVLIGSEDAHKIDPNTLKGETVADLWVDFLDKY